jgi:hypothetical protein
MDDPKKKKKWCRCCFFKTSRVSGCLGHGNKQQWHGEAKRQKRVDTSKKISAPHRIASDSIASSNEKKTEMSSWTKTFYTFEVSPSNQATTRMSHSDGAKGDDVDIRAFSNSIPGDIVEFKLLTRLSIAVEWSFLVRMRAIEPFVVETTKSLSVHMSRSIEQLPPDIGRLHRLERLDLDCLDQLQSLPPELGFLGALQELHISRCQALTSLPESLHKIKTLKNVSVEYCTSLESIPVAFQNLKLQKLRLLGLSRDVILNFFAHSWSENGSAQQIFVHDCKLGERYDEILSGLPHSLVNLSLHDNSIQTLNRFLERGLPRGIRKLSLNDNPILNSEDEKDQLTLERLLDTNPFLGNIGWWSFREKAKLLTPKLQYLLLANRCGRVLLGDVKQIPLSVWPTVMEGVRGAATNQRRRDLEDTIADSRNALEASVIYSLLQGPALLNRPCGFSRCSRKRTAQEDLAIAPMKKMTCRDS